MSEAYAANASLSSSGPLPQLASTATLSSSSVFKVKPEMDPLEREKREIERRRERLEDRKNRILHAKTRLIGIDTDALAEQIKEKQEKERQQRERDLQYDAQRVEHAKAILSLEQSRARSKKQVEESVHHYRKFQSTDRMARTSRDQAIANTSALGQSNVFLNFAGEDQQKPARVKSQQSQQSEWLTQQINDLTLKEQKERQDQHEYEAMQSTIVQIQNANVSEAEQNRKQLKLQNLRVNQTLTSLKKVEQKSQEEMNQKKDNEDIEAQLRSDILNESVFGSALGPNRTVPYHFKGFSQEKRQAILDEQRRQQEQLKVAREQSHVEEKDYAQQQEQIRRELIKQEREKQRLHLQRTMTLKEEIQAQKKQKDLRTQYLDKEVYTNPVSEQFFDQFGQSCR